MIALSAQGLLVVAIALAVGFLAVLATVAIAGPTTTTGRRSANEGRVASCPDCRTRDSACRYHTGYRAGVKDTRAGRERR